MPGIDGREYQLATMEVDFVGAVSTFTFESFRDIQYKIAAPKEAVKDHRGKNRGYTVKDEDTTGPSMRCLQSEWKEFKVWAAAQPNAKPVGLMEFSARISYGNDPSNLMEDTLDGVMFQEEGRKAGADQQALEVELPLFILHVHPHGGDFI